MTSKALELLLKSSMPLEQHVAEVALKNNLFPSGEFSYLRKTQTGLDSEFSVDILASANWYPKLAEDALIEINALIECKYASPSVKWVFSTTPNHESPYYSSVSIFNFLGPYLLENVELDKIEPKNYCIKGISLSESTADPTAIRHGLQQLRHAIPCLIDSLTTMYTSIYDEHPVPVVAPMLVTNAPIFLLRSGITIDEIMKSNKIEDIAEQKDIVCCHQTAGPELIEICQLLSKKIASKYERNGKKPSSEVVFNDLVKTVESVPVVSVNYLDSYLNGIRNVLTNSEMISLEDFGKKFATLGG